MKERLREWSKYLLPFLAAVAIYAFVTNYDGTMSMFRRIWSWVGFVAGRFAIGFGLAYFLDLLAVWMQTRLKVRRFWAVLITYITLLGAAAGMIIFIVPLIGESIAQIVAMAADFYQRLPAWLDDITERLDPGLAAPLTETVEEIVLSLLNFVRGLLNYTTVSDFLSGTGRRLYDIAFGLVISLYALIEKNKLVRASRQSVRALLPPERAETVIVFARRAHKFFSRFIVGRVVDSSIILLLSLILYGIFRVPLWPFMAVVAGVTNVIPYFGPLVGGVISCLIMLCFDPVYTLIVLGIIVVLQTFDGMYLGPKILGDAVGISPLLVVIAVTLGGDIGGFLGMFLGVPVLAVLKKLVYDEWVARKMDEKHAE
ncbi:MAG: AI-2E family transporter [Oscillospiraceae bacterium]|nr:AI-2E family transporter [Oscillospiraceae bacterium]